LLGGQVKVGCLGIASVMSNHKAGQLRILAVTSAKRSHELPEIPSISETLPGYSASLWQGLAAPRATPRAVIERIQRDMSRLLNTPEMKTAFERAGTDIVITDSKVFGELLKGDFEKWGKVAREINLQVD
jgi:tripartite-type tricarboxylate transporter receptor subunit TctC